MRLHRQKLHDLVLRDACWGLEAGFHWITTGAGGHVLDKRDAQWTTAVLVAREFGCILLVTIHNPDGYKKKKKPTNGGLAGFGTVKLHHTSAAGPAVRLVLDLGTVNLANRREEIHQVLVASRPRQLIKSAIKDASIQSE